GYWSLVYGTKPGEVAAFRRKIAEVVAKIEADPDQSDSPVSDFLKHEMLGVTGYLARESVKKLSALFTELTGLINTLQQLECGPQHACFLVPRCLDLLLTTLYVDVGASLLGKCYELRHALQVIHAGLRRDAAFVGQTLILASDVERQIGDLRA